MTNLTTLAETHNLPVEVVQALFSEFQKTSKPVSFNKHFGYGNQFAVEMQQRMNLFNEVVHNVNRKFKNVRETNLFVFNKTYKLSSINTNESADSKFITVTNLPEDFVLKRSHTLKFSYAPNNVGGRVEYRAIPASLLWMDPVAVAQYARKEIRAAQLKALQSAVYDAERKKEQVARDMARLQSELEVVQGAQIRLDAHKARAKKARARKLARLTRKAELAAAVK